MYLFMRDTQRERQRNKRRKKEAPCREPDVGLDPRTLGSGPEPEADTQPRSPRCPQGTRVLRATAQAWEPAGQVSEATHGRRCCAIPFM